MGKRAFLPLMIEVNYLGIMAESLLRQLSHETILSRCESRLKLSHLNCSMPSCSHGGASFEPRALNVSTGCLRECAGTEAKLRMRDSELNVEQFPTSHLKGALLKC